VELTATKQMIRKNSKPNGFKISLKIARFIDAARNSTTKFSSANSRAFWSLLLERKSEETPSSCTRKTLFTSAAPMMMPR